MENTTFETGSALTPGPNSTHTFIEDELPCIIYDLLIGLR